MGTVMRLNLRRLGLLAGKAARMFAARASLTPQRVDLLLLLRRETLKQSHLANYLCVTRSVVSRMVAALEEIGLVVRAKGLRDRRERYASITEAGRKRLALCFPKPTCHGAQDEGEIKWLRWWRESMASLGIRVDNVLRSRQPLFFASLAAKKECYPDPRDLVPRELWWDWSGVCGAHQPTCRAPHKHVSSRSWPPCEVANLATSTRYVAAQGASQSPRCERWFTPCP